MARGNVAAGVRQGGQGFLQRRIAIGWHWENGISVPVGRNSLGSCAALKKASGAISHPHAAAKTSSPGNPGHQRRIGADQHGMKVEVGDSLCNHYVTSVIQGATQGLFWKGVLS